MPLIEIRRFQNEKDKYNERLERYKKLFNIESESEQSLTDVLEESQRINELDESGIEFKRN